MNTENNANQNTDTNLDIPAERVLQNAMDANMGTAIVIGWDGDGKFRLESSVADGVSCLWFLEMAKKALKGTAG